MLCPEVINFNAPKSTNNFNKTHLKESFCLNKITSINYNHLISVVLPDTLQVPSYLTESLTNDCEYYKIENFDLSELVEKNFVNSFIKEGELNLISIDNYIDLDDCFCVTPTGKLILSLTKETYQSFGIEGTLSHYHQKTKDRYIVTIDLKKTLTFGQKLIERIKRSLKQLNKINVLLTWYHSNNEKVCPSSIIKYLSNLNYNIKLCKPNFKSETRYSLKVPKIDLDQFNKEDCQDFVEWLGLLCTNCDFNENSDRYLNSYQIPEPCLELGQVKILEWRGFYTKKHLIHLVEMLRKFISEKQIIWLSMYSQGFSDVPISFDTKEQHYYTNGDNSTCFIMNHNEQCVIYTSGVTNKMY